MASSGADKLKILLLLCVCVVLALTASQDVRTWMARMISGESSAVAAPASAASSRRAAVRRALGRYTQANYQPCAPLQRQVDACGADDASCRNKYAAPLAACTHTMDVGNAAVRSACSGYFSALSACAEAAQRCSREAENMAACRVAVETPYVKKLSTTTTNAATNAAASSGSM